MRAANRTIAGAVLGSAEGVKDPFTLQGLLTSGLSCVMTIHVLALHQLSCKARKLESKKESLMFT